jgi:hypothetical protein
MLRKFIFPLDQPRDPNYIQFEKEFRDCAAKTEQPPKVELLWAVRDRGMKRVYYLRSEPDQGCFDILIKKFDGKEELDEPAEQTNEIYPAIFVRDRIKSLVEEVLVELGRTHEGVSVVVVCGSIGEFVGEWRIQCGHTSFSLRVTVCDLNNLRKGHNEEIKTTIRQELSRT